MSDPRVLRDVFIQNVHADFSSSTNSLACCKMPDWLVLGFFRNANVPLFDDSFPSHPDRDL